MFCVPQSVKTKETNPTRPGSPTPCKQALSYLLLLSFSFTIPAFQHDGRTPIMEIVRSNAMDMVKVLIYATDDRKIWETKESTLVDLTLQDNEGKSVIHHCVQNREVALCL